MDNLGQLKSEIDSVKKTENSPQNSFSSSSSQSCDSNKEKKLLSQPENKIPQILNFVTNDKDVTFS